jgi:16S rRNA G1207 methylase RsmC
MQFSRTGNEDRYVARWVERQRSRQDTMLRVAGMEILVRRDVFSPDPAETLSTSFLIECLPSLHGKSVLDLGCGSGVLSLHAARHGASRVMAVDPDRSAVMNARENVAATGSANEIAVQQADLFEGLDGRFDAILANLPIADSAWPGIEEGLRKLYGRLIDQMPTHMTEGGACFISFASFGDIESFADIIADSPGRIVIHATRSHDVNWYVVQMTMV